MAVDWGFAGLVGGVGFGTVFVLLIILAVVVWLVGVVLSKLNIGKDETSGKKKGA